MVHTNDFIVRLVAGFEAKGWAAYTNAEEKEDIKQVVIQQTTADIVKETSNSYRYTPTISMVSVIDNDDLDSYLKEMISISEAAVTPAIIDWQLTDITIDPMGSTNLVTMTGQYVEIIYVLNI